MLAPVSRKSQLTTPRPTPRPALATDAPATAPAPGPTPLAPPDLTGLTAEEATLVEAGFLRRDFAALREAQRTGGTPAAIALGRKGIKGPFTRDYGNPDRMFDAARRWAKDPELARLVKAVQPGDIIATTFSKPDDVISVATKGPFIHTAICVSAGAPPEFVEAIGLTGDMRDPNGNKVLRSQMADHAWSGETVRLLRPAATLAPNEAEKAVKRAVAYAEAQLGKPYDFAFSDKDGTGWNDAFYCSELTYKAYASPKGADMPLPISKSPERDVATIALNRVLEQLKPDEPGKLAFEAAQLSADPQLTTDKLVAFIAEKILPATEATRAIADTPERRAAVERSLRQVLEGKAFTGFQDALRRHTVADQRGELKGVAGFCRRLSHLVDMGLGAIGDARELTRGIGFWRSLGVATKLVRTVVPEMDTLTKFFFGAQDGRTKQAVRTLDQLDGLARDARRVPLIGRFWPVPSRPKLAANREFVSPTDLGWAKLPSFDFNVKPGFPIDQATVEKTRPAYMK